jgi:hypothetical protein
MEEIWKPVDDFENLYEISSLGRIKRLSGYTPRYRGERIKSDSVYHPEIILKPTKSKKGYYSTELIKYDGYTRIRKIRLIHRIVLMSFNPNKDFESLQVNHINGIKNDNRLENLEWSTNYDNQMHAIKHGLKLCNGSSHRKVKQYTKDGKFIREYDSIAEAYRLTGIPNIQKVCRGERPFAGKFVWEYSNPKYKTYKIRKYTNLKFRNSLISSMRSSFKRYGFKFESDNDVVLGIDWDDLLKYFEDRFYGGMTWENYGYRGWHIDHIIPVCSAKTYDEMVKLCHYTNLRPMWAKDNLSKGNKIS